LTEEDKKKAL
jgi:Ras-related protein Rab-2A